jgi:hypothetical protein
MAVSHSFAGKHIEDGGDEKADAERQHRDIKHGGCLKGNSQLQAEALDAPQQAQRESQS